MRQEFQLPKEDVAGLDARNFKWETLVVDKVKWVIIRDCPIPAGYKVQTADLALRIIPAYPDDQIDMAYFFPALEPVNGKAIKNLTFLQIEGKQYQQWSRHRTQANPWKPGVDNICSHIILVDSWLQREVNP